MDTTRYHYGAGWQCKLIGLCFRDPSFLKFHADVIKPQWFESYEHQSLAYLMLVYFNQYSIPPDRSLLEALVHDYVNRHGGVRAEENRAKLLAAVHEAGMVNLNDYQAVKDLVVQFGQRQALKAAVGEIISLIDKDDEFPRARKILDEALKVGVTREVGTDLYAVYSDLDALIESDPLFSPKFKVPTFTPTLNRYLGGGIARGELGVIAAPPGRGKSTFLIDMGEAACTHFSRSGSGKSVVHISNELKEQDLVLKYVSTFTGIKMRDIATGKDKSYVAMLAGLNVIHPNSIRIKYFSPGSVDVAGVRGYMSFLQGQEGIDPGLLIVDYADRLLKDKRHEGDYAAMGEIYDQLIQLADDYSIPIWTASQVRRENFKEETVGLDGLADSWLKNANADIVMTLNQTKAEIEYKKADSEGREQLRLFMAKVRRGEDLGQIPCVINKHTATIREQPRGDGRDYPSVLLPGSFKD